MEIDQRILKRLEGKDFEPFSHPPAKTCEEAASFRNLDIKYGAKTVFMKSNKGFHLMTLSAAKKLDSNSARKLLGSQKLRFASQEELAEHLGVPQGAIPPLGRPFWDYDLWVDDSIWQLDFICFNIGVLTESIKIGPKDFLSMSEHHRGKFSL